MTPDEYCQAKAGGSGSSFYYSFLSLPPAKRRAITALYAFCREVDDTVDECREPEVARVKLAWWHGEIDAAFAGEPNHPVMHALLPAINAWRLPAEHFHDVVRGMQMDLDQQRYATFEELRLYCHRVASVVGLLSARIFGSRASGTEDFARDLGLAFQLINIIRDVGEDARRGRIYLPLEDLERFTIAPEVILHERDHPRLAALMEFEAQRAEALLQQALTALPDADRADQLPSLVMADIYRATLDEIRADGFRVLDHKIALPPWRLLWIAWRRQRRERRRVA
ncbi:MAG TPA: presqualene diphosphate synthase HpnD [Acidiferrobacterales bacterium]